MSDREGNYWTPLHASEVIWRTMPSILYWTSEKMPTNWRASRKISLASRGNFWSPNKTKKEKRLKKLWLLFWSSERKRRDWKIFWDAKVFYKDTYNQLFYIVSGKKKKKNKTKPKSYLIWRKDHWKVYVKHSFSLLKLWQSRRGCCKDLMTSEILKKSWNKCLGWTRNTSKYLTRHFPALHFYDFWLCLLSVITICKFKIRIWYEIIC